MSTHSDTGPLRAMNHDRGIPANVGANSSFDIFITREPRLVLGRNSVDVVSATQTRHTHIALICTTQKREHEIPGALGTCGVDNLIEGPRPLLRLVWINVDILAG